MEIAHWRRRSSLEPRRNWSIDGEPEVESTNRKTGTKSSMRRMQWYSRISPTMHEMKVIARRSCRRSWNRLELRREIPGIMDRMSGNGFQIWKGLGKGVPAIYIARVRR
jgi:hypothetical protein